MSFALASRDSSHFYEDRSVVEESMCTTNGRSQFRAELGVILGATGFLVGSLINSRWQATLFLQYRFLAEILPMLLAGSVLTVMGCLAAVIIKRRPLKAALVFTGLCFGLIRLTTGSDHFEGGWHDRFSEIRAPMEATIRETRNAHESEDDHNWHPLPTDSSALAYDNRVHTYRDPQDRTWFMFLQYMAGIDNGFGYAWSANDEPPPRRAFYEIVRTKRLGGGWYMFWTT